MKRASLANHLPGLGDITRVELSNGIIVLSRANFNSPSVVVDGYLLSGGLFDSDEKLGLADFTSAMLMRGTEQRSFQQIYESLESVGASLGIGSGTHTTSFNGKALAEDADMLLELLADALRHPIFPDDQVEKVRAQLLTSLAIRAQDTSEMAGMAFDRIIYRGHPYSRPEDGFPETIQAISQADLVAFQRRHYGPRGMVVAVVGALEPVLAVEKVAQVLGEWRNPLQPDPPPLPPVEPLQQSSMERVTIPGKFQADIVLGAGGPPRRSPDFLAAALGNSVLGQFGMMGRIGEAVREKAGLAYYAASSLAGGPGPGPWDVSAGVDPGNIDQAISLIIDEIRRFTSQPVKQEELSDSQANFIGRLPLSLESNGGVAAALVNLERYQLGLDYYRHYAELVSAVTTTDVLETARHYLDADKLGIAVAGP